MDAAFSGVYLRLADGQQRERHPPRPPLGSRAGFTILELLVVIGILGMLMSLGVGGYMALGRGFKLSGMESRLETVVRQARNTALCEGAPAGVFVVEAMRLELRDPAEHLEGEILADKGDSLVFTPAGRAASIDVPTSRILRRELVTSVRAVGLQTVALWHLENSDVGSGYLGRTCRLEGGEQVVGKIGGAVLLNAPGSKGKGTLVATASPDDSVDPYMLPDGGRIAMWIHALPPGADGYLFRREKSYELRLSQEGVLEGGPAGHLLTADSYVVPLGRWVYVALLFRPGYVEISVDGVVRAVGECDELDPPEKAELVFGRGFPGLLDEIRMQRRVQAEALEIPDDFEIAGPKAVFFDDRGRLDPRVHSGAVSLTVGRDGKKIGFTVSRNGLIELIK